MKAYLELMEGLFLFTGITLTVGAGMICDGTAFETAVRMILTGIVAMAGVFVCQGLKKLH